MRPSRPRCFLFCRAAGEGRRFGHRRPCGRGGSAYGPVAGLFEGVGGSSCGVRSSSFFSAGNLAPSQSAWVRLGPLRSVDPAPGASIPMPSVHCRAQRSGRRGLSLKVMSGGPPSSPPPQLTQPRAFLRAVCSVAFCEYVGAAPSP